jgi:hypothetical protein
MYNVEEDDIYNQYNVENSETGNVTNQGINFRVYDLIIIEGVNELQLLDNDYENPLVGYTPININESRVGQIIMKTNNSNQPVTYSDSNIIRLPGRAIINKITCRNIKGGLIPTNTPSKIIGIFSKNGSNSSNIFFGNYKKGVNLTTISLSEFNNIVTGNDIPEPVDETYIFSIYMEYLQEPYDQYQLEITIDYTLL